MSAEVIHGDCLMVLPTLAANSVDAGVCDPPYGLAFMGKAWDHGVPGVPFWEAVLRVAKPGAYLLACGGTRTYHRLTCAIEDAGFEIHDCLSWLYGSGFPKHASKLKPAWEPIVLARKPAPRATPLNIDACRIGVGGQMTWGGEVSMGFGNNATGQYAGKGSERASESTVGRWPPNVCMDEEAAAALDAQSGILKTGAGVRRPRLQTGGTCYSTPGTLGAHPYEMDANTGGASRFMYVAKASRAEREAGLDGFAAQTKRILNGGIPSAVNSDPRGMSGGGDRQARNHHPTVKPLAIMRWLVRLVTPPEGGLVLDPFAGSGSTGCAAVLEGRRFLGIEREAEYVEIARARIAHWSRESERLAPAPDLFAEGAA